MGKFATPMGIAGVVLVLTGCLTIEGGRTAELTSSRSAREVVSSRPAIRIELHHAHRFDGKPRATNSTRIEIRRALGRLQKRNPVLSNAGFDVSNPDLVLAFDTEVNEGSWLMAMIAGGSLTLVPTVQSVDLAVRATLRRPDGEVLATATASSRLRQFVHVLLLPVTPLNRWTSPGDGWFEFVLEDALERLVGPEVGSPPGAL